MTKFASSLLILLAASLACAPFSSPAHAARDRVFVASYGNDNNPCTFGSPCKTFQVAVAAVAPGGEVTAIDSAGFGTITIMHAVTITSPNGVEAGIAAPESGGAAITINASPGDVISLNGLTLDGDNVANSTGIQFNSGGTLEVNNTAIRNFTGSGIVFLPNGTSNELYVSNTVVSNNSLSGIDVAPGGSGTTTKGLLDHVRMQNNMLDGLTVTTASSQAIKLTVSDCFSVGNAANGITATGAGTSRVTVIVRDSTITNNAATGLAATNNATGITVTRSTVSGNGTAYTTTTNGVVSSYGDNNFEQNDATTPALPLFGYK